MALIICPECGKQFSDQAPACPNCGFPTEKIVQTEAVSENAETFGKKQKTSRIIQWILGVFSIVVLGYGVWQAIDNEVESDSFYVQYARQFEGGEFPDEINAGIAMDELFLFKGRANFSDLPLPTQKLLMDEAWASFNSFGMESMAMVNVQAKTLKEEDKIAIPKLTKKLIFYLILPSILVLIGTIIWWIKTPLQKKRGKLSHLLILMM